VSSAFHGKDYRISCIFFNSANNDVIYIPFLKKINTRNDKIAIENRQLKQKKAQNPSFMPFKNIINLS